MSAWNFTFAGLDAESVFNAFSETAHLKPQVQRQLQVIYLTLLSTVAYCLAGYYTSYLFPVIGDKYFLLPVLGVVATTLALCFLKATPGNLSERRTLLWAHGWLTGIVLEAALGPLVHSGDGDMVCMAVVLATVLFASFSVATMVSSRQQTIYVIGAASTALTVLLGLQLVAWLYPTSMSLFGVNMIVGVAVSCFYVVFHTHEVLEKARRGERLDPVVHALLFFSDFVKLFLKMIELLKSND
ncbi:Inhibitor of apoptosis-promoting Bax1-related protein, partial [Coemansia aciculifera]